MPNGDVVEVGWDARRELLRRIRQVANASSLLAAFEWPGKSGLIELSAEGVDVLEGVFDFWPGGAGAVPAELEPLEAAVRTEIARRAVAPPCFE